MIGARLGLIGVEISPQSVRLAQLRFEGAKASLHALAEFTRLAETSPLEAEAERIAGVLRRRGFVGVRLAVCLGPEQILSAEMELPPVSSGAPIEQLAAAEFARAFKQDAAALEVAVWEIPVPARQHGAATCMANACSHETSGAIVAAFDRVGLDVRRVEPREMALARACLPKLAGAGAITLLVSLRLRGSRLLAVHNNTVVLDRPLEGGDLRSVYEETASASGLDVNAAPIVLAHVLDGTHTLELDDATRNAVRASLDRFGSGLIEEIHTACGYVGRRFGGREVARMLVTADGPEAAPIADLLGAVTSLDTHACTIGDIAQIPPTLRLASSQGGFLAAVGAGYGRRKGDQC
ncbi:MAG: hypothetical protein K2Y21_07600 [Phycisphaerales bacterium]|nr:hypothetical protein [Phycisphaerales bacterium]